MNRTVIVLPILAALSVCKSFAIPITFTYTATGTGTIGGTHFTNVGFTITASGDTANRQSFFCDQSGCHLGGTTGFFIDHSSASISITGVGTFQFTSATRTFVNNAHSIAGFSRGSINGFDLLYPPLAFGLATWDMLSSFGPIAGTGRILQWSPGVFTPVTTTGGTLTISDGNPFVTFQASVAGMSAIDLAKSVVGAPYLWGGKGWDYNSKRYVDAPTIFSGYVHWNADLNQFTFDAGLDCSGLVMWSYNKAAGATSRLGSTTHPNPIYYEGADGQFRYNSQALTEAALMPGDLLFFKFSGTSVDHVAMYVGPIFPGGNDVIQASQPGVGIISSRKDTLKALPGFAGFRRPSAPQVGIAINSHSPVTLIVTDPDGNTINSTTLTTTLRERLREVPGILYYTEDANGDDVVFAPTVKIGTYLIQVSPKPGTSPNDTYSLDVSAAGQTVTLAQNMPIRNIPNLGYAVQSTGAAITAGTPYVTGQIIGKGQQAPGVLYLDLQLKNTGTGPAYQISINNIQFRALTGSGTVTYNASLGPPLPLTIPTLGIGSTTTMRLFANVPPTVRRFSVTEGGIVRDAIGVSYAMSMTQAVIP